jgi:aryl-alcohol dehydrogenase-like predicted oxidoreductase
MSAMTVSSHQLGRTGLVVSRIGLGLGADRSVENMRSRTHAVLDAAQAAGIRYLDAARSYGRAEEFLAEWLTANDIAPGDVTIGSKWGYRYTGEWRLDARVQETKDLSIDNLRRQLVESRAFLNDHLGLYQIHSATLESGVLEDQRVLAELRQIKATGLVIGLTVTGPRQSATIDRALDIDVFDTVQATWNLFERSATEALERAHAQGLGVIIKEALANGRLAGTGAEQPLGEVARDYGVTPDAIALAVVLDQPWVDVVLSGAVSVDQLRSNMSAEGVSVDDTLRSRVCDLVEPPEQYWAERAHLAWS